MTTTKKKATMAKPTTRETHSLESERKLKYRRMVAAVREWLAVEHPREEDCVDICLFDSIGNGGNVVAQFHADSSYLRGDLMALEPAD